jgi:hypothetical protein
VSPRPAALALSLARNLNLTLSLSLPLPLPLPLPRYYEALMSKEAQLREMKASCAPYISLYLPASPCISLGRAAARDEGELRPPTLTLTRALTTYARAYPRDEGELRRAADRGAEPSP